MSVNPTHVSKEVHVLIMLTTTSVTVSLDSLVTVVISVSPKYLLKPLYNFGTEQN